jgi:hypothetical protein
LTTDKEVDVDEATVAIIRAHHEKLEDLQGKIERSTSYTERRGLLGEFHAELLRQEAILSETPGLEENVRQIRAMREQFEKQYGVG